ncbi:MAG TPA: HPP family protein [Peptococcaceae bacterium]|nr:MAG: CBS-domain-containing membrane protein [Clostridia bacterium 41_269]HBT20848.1 HPP family protein [Peptococcaceae bacterium]
MSRSDTAAVKASQKKFEFSWREYFAKIKSKPREHPLPGINGFDLFISWLGAFLGISTVAYLTLTYDVPLMVASFGASAVLIYGVPDVPLAQPRNVFFGHVISATIGVIIYYLFGLTWWSTALGCSLSIAAMLVTKTTHPPAGATGMVAVWTQQSPQFIITPVAVGALILIFIGLITNNLSPRRSYPKYWF